MLAPTIAVNERFFICAENNKYTVFLKMNGTQTTKLKKILHGKHIEF